MSDRKHLFICAARKSGSTLLHRAIWECLHAATLPSNGDAMKGFQGVQTNPKRGEDVFTFGRLANDLQNESNYDWDSNQKLWEERWNRLKDAKVNVEMSFANVLRIDQLCRFNDPHFILLVRNPYASISETIAERKKGNRFAAQKLNASPKHVAAHYLNILKRQIENEKREINSLTIRYEDLCIHSESVQKQFIEFLPELDDVNISRRRTIGEYDEEVRNMNHRSIISLLPKTVAQINEVFHNSEHVLEHFDYERQSPRNFWPDAGGT